MINLKDKLRLGRDEITAGWLIIFSGTAIRIGLNFLSGILIIRALGPVDFGSYALLMALAGLVGVGLDFGLTETAIKKMAIYWPGQPHQMRRQGQLFIWLRLGLVLIGVTVILMVAQPLTAYLLPQPNGAWLIGLALIGVITTTLSGSTNAILQASHKFDSLALTLVSSSAFALLIAGALAISGWLNLTTTLLGLTAGTSLAGFIIGYQLLRREWGPANRRLLQPPTWGRLRHESPSLLRFGKWLWWANLCKVLLSYLDMFLVNLWLSPATVGLYALALGLASRAEIVNHSLYTVLIPLAAGLTNRPTVWRYLGHSLLRSGAVSLLFIGLMIIAPWLIPLIYGPAYEAAGPLFQFLLGLVIFDILTLPATLLIYTFNRPDLSAMAETLQIVILIILAMWLIPQWGAVGAIIAKFIAKVSGVILILSLLARQMVDDS